MSTQGHEVVTLWRHGRQRHWNIGGGRSQVERQRRENRGAVGGEEVVSWEGPNYVPLPRKFMNFMNQWCDIWCILGVLFLRFMCPMDCS